MKHKLSFVLGIFGGVILLLIIFSTGAERPRDTRPSQPANNSGAPLSLEPQTKSQGEVSITVTPAYDTKWSFDIALETHSVELSESLDAVSVLIDDKNREYAPVAWEGDPPGGHHRKGILRFGGDIDSSARSLTLAIRKLGGIPERTFTWTLGQ